MYAAGRGDSQLEAIKRFGATGIDFVAQKVSDYVDTHTGGAGFDVVFDSVGGANMTNSFEAAALNAHVATTVSMVEIDLTPAHFKGLSLHVVFMLIPMLHDHKREEHGNILAQLSQIVEAGALTPMVDEQQFKLEEIGLAHDKLTSGQATGKVVVEV